MPHLRQSLVEVVCQQLREKILAQRWCYTLPGIRILCEEVQVSRQTMMLALRLLEEEGFVQPAIPGKPRSINQEMVNPADPIVKKEKNPVIAMVARYPETKLSQTDAEICSALKKSLIAEGFVYRHIVFRYLSRAMGAKSITEIIEQNPADVYLVIGSHSSCSRALKKLELPIVYLGGGKVEGCSPLISYSVSQMCDLALGHLLSIGHRKISVMLPENFSSASKGESEAERAMGKVFAAHKIPFSTYNCPRWGKTKEEFNQKLEKLFSVTPPTALILGDIEHVPRVVSFLMRKGLKYPDDVSLIVLDQAPELQQYEPPISYFHKNNPGLAKIVLNSVRKKLAKLPDEEVIITPAKLVLTGSVAEPPRAHSV